VPYIKSELRQELEPLVSSFYEGPIESPGELNYLVSHLCLARLNSLDRVGYKELNEIIGVLECAKQEFYRRMVSEYEDDAIDLNGDIYE
jgi:hypothetical protein